MLRLKTILFCLLALTLFLQGSVNAVENKSSIVSPYWQTDSGSYTFLAISHPSLTFMNSQIGVRIQAQLKDGSKSGVFESPNPNGIYEFTISRNQTKKVFIVTTNDPIFNPGNFPSELLIVKTGSGAQGQLAFSPIASDPESYAGNTNSEGRGHPDITMLSLWGAVVVQSTSTGFAMEFVGDHHDSVAQPRGGIAPSGDVTVGFNTISSSGSESSFDVNVPVVLNQASPSTVNVNYSVSGGTASGSGADYVLSNGSLSFAPGETSKNINVLIVDDALAESNETISLNLSDASNANLGTSSFTYTILDDESTPSVAFDQTTAGASEETSDVPIAVSLSAASGASVSVQYAVTGGTAVLNTDYSIANTDGGTLSFTPGEISKDIILSVVDDGQSESDETLEITLSNASNASLGTNTTHTYSIITVELSGQVLDTNVAVNTDGELPIVGATVSLKGTGISTTTDSNGNFVLTNIPTGEQVLDIDATTADPAPDESEYASFREGLMIEDAKNTIQRPFYLPRIDGNSLTTVNPMATTEVNNSNLGVSISISAGNAKNEDNSDFTGEVSISEVPENLAPVALPENINPGLLITVQPAGLIFTNPVPITFPNVDDLPSGTLLDIWSVNPDTGTFSIVGQAQVNDDGIIETISGGLSLASWHTMMPPEPETDEGENNEENDDRKKEEKECTGSQTTLCAGHLTIIHPLASYKSFNQIQEMALIYNSLTADPRPIIVSKVTNPVVSAVPLTVSTNLEIDGVIQDAEVFTDTSVLNEDVEEVYRQARQFDANSLATGVHLYRMLIKNNFLSSSIAAIKSGRVLVHNRNQSPFGAGWGLSDTFKMTTSNVVPGIFPNGAIRWISFDLAISQGDGSIQAYRCSQCTLGENELSGPPGSFTTLTRKGDGSAILRFKDGTEVFFDTQGRHFKTVDRNGNTKSYIYDGTGKLAVILDPVGKAFRLSYTNDLLSSVVDPANRTTSFQYDGNDNLTKITDPDGSIRQFGYDSNHRMTSQTSKNGFVTNYDYNFAGRNTKVTRPDNSTATVEPIQVVGLVDPDSGFGTEGNPAPLVFFGKVKSTYTDGNGNQTIYEVDSFGATTSKTDPLGNVTTTVRDENGLPTLITLPDGSITTFTYDSSGNVLTATESNTNGDSTNTFTYESTFNKETSFSDPNGNEETFEYDASGNLIRSTDAMGTQTEFKYEDPDCPGLVTKITSAVGLSQESRLISEYDDCCNLKKITDPLGNTIQQEYDSTGNVSKTTDALGRSVRYQYDALNRVTKAIDDTNSDTDPPCGTSGVTCFEYDANGNETVITDGRGNTTQYAYDERDFLVSRTDPVGNQETYQYDANGNITFKVKRDGQPIFLEYDGLDRLIRKTILSKANPLVEFNATQSEGAEDETPASISVTLSAVLPQTITVDYIVSGGTATGGGVDFTLANGALTFSPGEISKTIDIAVVDDGVNDPNETIEITLSNPTNSDLGPNIVHTFTIQ